MPKVYVKTYVAIDYKKDYLDSEEFQATPYILDGESDEEVLFKVIRNVSICLSAARRCDVATTSEILKADMNRLVNRTFDLYFKK